MREYLLDALQRADWYSCWMAISVFVTVIAFSPYAINLWKANDDLSPTISGWSSWMFSDATIFAAQIWTGYESGFYGNVGWQNAIYVMGPLLVIGLSLRKGLILAERNYDHYTWRDAFRDWDRNDKGEKTYKDSTCVVIVALAIFAWTRTDNALYAIGFTTISTVVGTFAVTWPLRLDPYREDFRAWVLFLIGGLAGVIAVKDAIWPFDWVNGYPPILFVGVQLTLVILTGRRYTAAFKKTAP